MNDKNVKTIVVNLLAGPGAGKSTSAWQIAAALKIKGFNAEYVSEFAKELVYEGMTGENDLLDGSIESQTKIFREQRRRIDRLISKVDIIVTDAPLILNSLYLKGNGDVENRYKEEVLDAFNEFTNFNIFIERLTDSKYEERGRIQSLQEAIEKDIEMLEFLEKSGIRTVKSSKIITEELVLEIIRKFEIENSDRNI